MNHIYRVVYNTASQTYQAVPEISKGKHKSCAEKTSAAASKTPTFAGKLRALCAAFLALTCPFALAAPTGGAVSAGQAAIHQAGNITDIRQSSQNAAINWQNFSIGAHETVNFHQPNAESLTLNRVIGNERSIIDGAMNANGKVFISNPNGMLIGRDAQINVGSLVATTAQISNDDFMNGRYQFTNAKGEIENLSNITVPQGGVVALIAPIVKHSGTITAPKAHTLLASADSFSITLPDNANFAYTLDKGTLQGLVDNGGAILADGGRVVLTAKGVDSVKKSLIKHTGVIEANTVQNNKGVIELLGDLDNSALNVSGSLKAEAKGADKGGFVETSASQVKIHDSAVVSTKSEQGQTGTWLIDPKDLIIANSGGDMTATQVENALKSNNIALHTIRNTQGKNDGKGDIKINDAISWNANTLTLNAENDIHINANLNGSGTAKLALEYGQGSKDGKYKAVVDGKETTLDNDYYLDKNTPLKDRTVKVNLPEGKNFSVKKGSNGETVVFDVIHQMPEIIKNADGDWESKFTERNIAFGADMDVGYTKGYDGFAGWQLPKDSKPNRKWGRVAGLGHTVKGLSLHSKKDSQDTGLFQNQGDNAGYLRDIGVIDVNVRSDGRFSDTGGLAGHGTSISNSYATGNVSSAGNYAVTGGLAGYGHHISNSYATGDVSSAGWKAYTGGLAGRGTSISNSYATGNVSSAGVSVHTGGLAGWGNGISNSYATGNVSSTGDGADAGGLVGLGWDISNSYATGDVSSAGKRAYTGGLMGWGYGISNSYATGDVSSAGDNAEAGGLAGFGYKISNSYATGDVSSAGEGANAGGLVGGGYGISNSYANNTSIKATGKDSAMAGLIGDYYYNNIYYYYDNYYYHYDKYHYYYRDLEDSFFNQDKHPTLPAIGKYADNVDKSKIVNVTGKTEAELKQKSTFTDAGWDFDKVWYMNDGSMPKLRAFAQTLTVNPAQTTAGVKAPDLSKTYDGKAVNTVDDLKKLNGWKDNFDADGLTTGDSVNGIFKAGTLTIDETKGDWKGAKDVKEGGYSLYPTGTLKDEYQQKYIIEWNKGVLTINKKPISIIGNKTYDGTNNAYQPLNLITGIKDQLIKSDKEGLGLLDIPTLTGQGKLAGKDVAENIKLTDKGNLALSGSTQKTKDVMKNYEIDFGNSHWTIAKRPLTIQAMNNIKPESDNNPDVSRIGIVVTGLVEGESISDVNLSYSDDKKWQGDISIIRVGEPVFSNGKASNYAITKNHGKLLTVQREYDLKNLTDKKPEDVAKIRDLLNHGEIPMLLADAVYGDRYDDGKGGDTGKDGKKGSQYYTFYNIYEITDTRTGFSELKPFKNLDSRSTAITKFLQDNPHLIFKKKYEVVENDPIFNGVKTTINIQNKEDFGWGLTAALYKSVDTANQEYYVVFRGSDKGKAATINPWHKDGGDAKANIGQIIQPTIPNQYKEAKKFTENIYNHIKNNNLGKMVVVGHSLGGGLSAYSAGTIDKDLTSITFNPAPLGVISMAEIGNKIGHLNVPRNAKLIFDNDTIGSFGSINLGYTFKINFLPNTDDSGENHGMSHIIKTQKLANIVSENNEISAKCRTGCVKLQEHQWTPSRILHNIDNGRPDYIYRLISDRNRVEREISEINKTGGNSYRQREELRFINQKIDLIRPARVIFGGEISISRNGETFNIKRSSGWEFRAGDIITSGNQRTTIHFHDGSWIELAPNSSVRIEVDHNIHIQLATFIADNVTLISGQILQKANKLPD